MELQVTSNTTCLPICDGIGTLLSEFGFTPESNGTHWTRVYKSQHYFGRVHVCINHSSAINVWGSRMDLSRTSTPSLAIKWESPVKGFEVSSLRCVLDSIQTCYFLEP